eukprot:3258774-Prymnesium_polylepis.1
MLLRPSPVSPNTSRLRRPHDRTEMTRRSQSAPARKRDAPSGLVPSTRSPSAIAAAKGHEKVFILVSPCRSGPSRRVRQSSTTSNLSEQFALRAAVQQNLGGIAAILMHRGLDVSTPAIGGTLAASRSAKQESLPPSDQPVAFKRTSMRSAGLALPAPVTNSRRLRPADPSSGDTAPRR